MKIFNLKVSNIKKRFDERFSLDVNELEITSGGLYGIIGPNGCGKTTLMKIIAGLIKADKGQIDYGGLTNRDITMLFRRPYLIHDTVLQNLIYPLKIRGQKPDPALIEDYLEMAGLQDHRKQYAPGLSGGEQQKLALIRALIFKPKFILIDEAFSNLDIESAGVFEEFILKGQENEPATYLICAHQISHIRRLCGYVFFMQGGKLEDAGSVEEILINPKNPKLQNYLQYIL